MVAITVTFSCSKTGSKTYEVNSASDVNEFVKEQKEKSTYEKKIKEVNYKLIYITNEQMALRDIKDLSKIEQTQFDSIIHNYDSLLFFNLEISIDNFNDDILKYKLEGDMESSYTQLVDYYAFKMQKDISIVQNEKDTMPCVLYHYERNYGVSPKTNILLGFKIPKLYNAVFVYENKHLKTGIIKFIIEEKEIKNHPHIKIV